MQKLQKVKYIIIAAGVLVSAAFYVFGGSAKLASGGDSLIIGYVDEGAENNGGTDIAYGGAAAESYGNGASTAPDGGNYSQTAGGDGSESVGNSLVSGDARSAAMVNTLSASYAERLEDELYIGTDGRGYLSDELKQEIRTFIRTAIREELTAICEEGYLEQAASEAAAYAAAEAERKAGMVNINTADVSELMTLPGIGEKRAGDIVSYRETHGAFGTPEDIMQVSGIKQSAYDKIKDKIYT